MSILATLKYNADGLIPAIIQDHENGEVLMMAWMNEEAVRRTLESGLVTYWSRSREKYWVKGETSGHFQKLKRMSVDCDVDTLLLQVEQTGAACHENYRSCFFRDVETDGLATNETRFLG
jgi:phosphoribosyl-AMP cyclohydrolase